MERKKVVLHPYSNWKCDIKLRHQRVRTKPNVIQYIRRINLITIVANCLLVSTSRIVKSTLQRLDGLEMKRTTWCEQMTPQRLYFLQFFCSTTVCCSILKKAFHFEVRKQFVLSLVIVANRFKSTCFPWIFQFSNSRQVFFVCAGIIELAQSLRTIH